MNNLRYAAIGAALLAGTAAARAQTVITTVPDYVAPPLAVAPAPVVVAPAPAVVAPAPDVVVAPAPIVEEDRIVTSAPPVVTETIVPPAPERRIIRERPRTTQVRLTTRQRHEVLRTVRAARPARTVTERVSSYRVGTVLPAAVPVYAMPRQVIYEAPALRGYDYTLVGDRMLAIDPRSNTVIDEIY